jgi:hypothetical protein
MLELHISTSGFFLMPDSYYYVYEQSTNNVLTAGNLSILQQIFDNFASSPGTIILDYFLKLIANLDTVFISIFEGIFGYILLFVFMLLLLRNLYNSFNYKIALIAVFSSGFTAVFSPIYTYSIDAYLQFLIVLVFVISRSLKDANLRIEDIMILVVATISMVIKYLPLGIFTIIIMTLLLLLIAILRESKNRIKLFLLILLISLITISIYFTYLGQYFYSDFNVFTKTIVKFIKFEQITSMYKVIESRVRYDWTYTLLWILSLFRYMLAIAIILFLLVILTVPKIRKLIMLYESKSVVSFNALGVLLYLVGIGIYIFVSWVSDYGLRLYTLSYASYVTSVYTILRYSRYDYKILSKVWLRLRSLIIILIVLALVGALVSPITAIYYGVKGFSLSVQYRYGQEGLWTSTYVKEKLIDMQAIRIVATYRYIYLFSRYGIAYYILYTETDTNLSKMVKEKTLLIIPSKITEIPDATFGPISRETLEKLYLDANIILNTGISVSFYGL